MAIDWIFKSYENLTKSELHQLMRLRQAVFVVEQNCPYQDVDGKDLLSIHVLGYIKNQLVAYARVLEQGVSYQEYASIGRIVTSRSIRGKKFGHDLVNFSIKVCQKNFSGQPIKISAQAHLEMFYNKHKFKATGEAYLEDDIPHIGMILMQE